MDGNRDASSKRRALTACQADSGREDSRQTCPRAETDLQAQISDIPSQQSEPAIEAARPVNNAEERSLTMLNPYAERLRSIRSIRPEGNTTYHGSTKIGRNNLVEHAKHHPQREEREKSQPYISNQVAENTVPQRHCLLRFEPSLPVPPQTNNNDTDARNCNFQGDGDEDVDHCATVGSTAHTGLRSPSMSETSRHTRYVRMLAELISSGGSVLIQAFRALAVRALAAARASENSGSVSDQARESSQCLLGRDQTDHTNGSQSLEQADPPGANFLQTSTRDLTESAPSASVRLRGASGLEPSHADQPQQDNRSNLQYLQGEFLKVQRTSGMLPPHVIEQVREEIEMFRRRADESGTGGKDRISASPKTRPQGYLVEPACANCRKKKRKCDRKKPRCE